MSSSNKTKKDIEISKQIKKYLEITKMVFEEDQLEKDKFKFLFRLPHEQSKLTVLIGQEIKKDYKIEVASLVKFAESHIEMIKKFTETEKRMLVDDMIFTTAPLDIDLIIELEMDEDKYPKLWEITPHYLVMRPIYIEDLSFSEIHKSIRVVHKTAFLLRRIVQIHMNIKSQKGDKKK